MSLLQSALDFLAGPGSLGGAAARDQTDFVGQTVEMGELRLRVRRVLAEGEMPGSGLRASSRLTLHETARRSPLGLCRLLPHGLPSACLSRLFPCSRARSG
uniref:Cyclin G associated kinase n=1 Tax=Ovis aries TaxID=9940 RepID=A0AC11DFW7_SHEEP